MIRFPTDRLAREWPGLAARALAPRLREWAKSDRRLAGFESPQALLRFLRSRSGDLDRKDAILAFLLERARADELAARTVLEAILPGLKRLAGSVFHEVGDEEELSSLLLWCAWEEIRAFPLERRRTRIAANLLLDTRKRMRAALTEARRASTNRDRLPPARARTETGDVDALLARAVAAGAISGEEAELIARTRIDELPLVELARSQDAAYDALRIRRSRAERRLLLFLGQPHVRSGHRKRRLLGARAAGAGLAGSAGGGAVTDPKQRR